MNNNTICYYQNQSNEEIVQILIDFLGEFLLYLSSICECQQSYSQYQLKRIVDIAERVHQFRSTLLIQINHINNDPMNSVILDLPSIGVTLQELVLFIRCLCKEQQSFGTISEQSHMTLLTQLLDWIEKLTKYCMNCINRNSNIQCCQYPISNINSCQITSQMNSIGCGYSCNESNICMPWSFFERMKNSADRNDQIFGVMYGIQDKNIRQKLGYHMRKSGLPKRIRQKIKQNRNDRGLIIRSNDGIIPSKQKTSFASVKEIFTSNDQQKEINERNSYKSILSQDKNSIRVPGSIRSLSAQQSPINSKQSSPLFPSHSDIEESMRLHSIQDRLATSTSNSRMINNSLPSHSKDPSMTSINDQNISQYPSSHQILTQSSDANKDYDDKSTRSLSFQSYGYTTPSKATIKVSRESNQSLSPIPNKSIIPHLSNISTLSPQTASINSMRRKKKSSSVVQDESKQSLQENSNVYQTNSNIVNSRETMISDDNILNRSWEKRLSSPLSTTSTKHVNSIHFSQNLRSSKSSKQPSLNTTSSDSNFHDYSKYRIPSSTSFRNETHGDMSILNAIEESQSVEGVEHSMHSSPIIDQRKEQSTPQLSSINTYRQQSTSATYDNDHTELLSKIKRHSFSSIGDRKRKFYIYETDDLSLQRNKQGYFHKFMNCFRRTNNDRLKYRNR